ncbi:hypothetical protein FRACYDRAFT_218877 [Fragilariopsis cylindrus CCMP1102]|uniref:Uncharacterized protein n=1 Tax=Fragilariopsis cylindrus CCMP1102 TaxID=635003 RepID=A0A1E7F654_9STRA|nr:hypothetical protein FRACYDRAFT_218877 [Fragilariopsis cylindrus CCMP1102]|eukprot:OEU13671.1 hypothetical protein FRACYDRAFT_218877 [Fragilariopsis cylindrus CCMP1102]
MGTAPLSGFSANRAAGEAEGAGDFVGTPVIVGAGDWVGDGESKSSPMTRSM